MSLFPLGPTFQFFFCCQGSLYDTSPQTMHGFSEGKSWKFPEHISPKCSVWSLQNESHLRIRLQNIDWKEPSFQYKTSGFHLKSPHQPGDSIRHLFIPYPWVGHLLTFEFGSRFHSPSQKRSRFFFQNCHETIAIFDDTIWWSHQLHQQISPINPSRQVETQGGEGHDLNTEPCIGHWINWDKQQ